MSINIILNIQQQNCDKDYTPLDSVLFLYTCIANSNFTVVPNYVKSC